MMDFLNSKKFAQSVVDGSPKMSQVVTDFLAQDATLHIDTSLHHTTCLCCSLKMTHCVIECVYVGLFS